MDIQKLGPIRVHACDKEGHKHPSPYHGGDPVILKLSTYLPDVGLLVYVHLPIQEWDRDFPRTFQPFDLENAVDTLEYYVDKARESVAGTAVLSSANR